MIKIDKTLSVICASLFVITGLIALFLFNIEQKAFSAETFKQTFKAQGLYESVPSLLTSALKIANDPSDSLATLNQDQMELFIRSLLPPNEMEAFTNSVFDSAFDYINGKTDSISISMLPFKQNMTGDAGVKAFQQILTTQPACTAEQILNMSIGVLLSNQTMILCNPPKETLDLMAPLIASQLQSVSLGIPNELTLFTADQADSTHGFRPSLNRIRAIMKLSPVLPLFFLFILTLMKIRDLDEWLRWWGIPFIILGAFGTFLAIIGAPITRILIDTVISHGNSDLPTILINVFRDMTGALTRQILKPVMIEGLIFLSLGSGMYGTDLYLKKKGYV